MQHDGGSPWAFLNGEFLPPSQGKIALHDAGFVLGATVTDLCRTFRHRLYRWQDHLARFRRSCQAAFLTPPMADDEITAVAHELVARNSKLLSPDADLALMVFITPGPVSYYLGENSGAGSGPVTFGMHTFPLAFARYRPLLERGAALVIPSTRQSTCVNPHIKHRSRMHWWIADQQAQQIQEGSIALLLDEAGHITETAAANLLVVRDGRIVSPRLERVLQGISLAVVRELSAQLGISFVETDLTPGDVVSASEAMLTSTPYCLAGVQSLDGHPIPWPGPVLRRLQAAWSERVGLDIVAQILG